MKHLLNQVSRIPNKFLTEGLHSLFFGKAQVKQKREWLDQFERMGSVEKTILERNGGKIEILRVRPKGKSRSDLPAVVFSHPMKRKAKSYFANDPRAEWYLKNGFECYFFDFNGFGNSERIDLFFWKDAKSVVELAKIQHPGRPIVLHGVSFGAFHQIRATSALPEGSVVILENVSRSLKDYWKRSKLTSKAVSVLSWMGPDFIEDMDVLDFLRTDKKQDIAFHFLACQNDSETPALEMETLRDAVGPSAASVTFEKCEHLEAPSVHRKLYFKTLENIVAKSEERK